MFGFSSLELEALQISLKVSLWSVSLSLPLAMGVAWLLARKEFRGKAVVFTWQGAAIAASVVAFPLFVRPIRQALEGVDPRLEEAAITLGANRRQAFFAVTLPIVMPGVLTGALLFFARALGEFGATITFAANIPGETQTLPLALYAATQTPGGDPIALRLVFLSLGQLKRGIDLLMARMFSELMQVYLHRILALRQYLGDQAPEKRRY